MLLYQVHICVHWIKILTLFVCTIQFNCLSLLCNQLNLFIMSKPTLDELREQMSSNGYAYFNTEAFKNKTDAVCYIPENAKSRSETFTYAELKKEVDEWCEANPEYMEEHETTPEAVLINLYENITWEFPATFLDGLDY